MSHPLAATIGVGSVPKSPIAGDGEMIFVGPFLFAFRDRLFRAGMMLSSVIEGADNLDIEDALLRACESFPRASEWMTTKAIEFL